MITPQEIRKYGLDSSHVKEFTEAKKKQGRDLAIVVVDGHSPSEIGSIFVRLSARKWMAFTAYDTFTIKCYKDMWHIEPPFSLVNTGVENQEARVRGSFSIQNSRDDFGGGYGKGYKVLIYEFKDLRAHTYPNAPSKWIADYLTDNAEPRWWREIVS